MGFNFSRIKKIIIDFTPEKIKRIYQEPLIREWKKSNFYGIISYSQEGEDLILKRIFEGQKSGFYVDVGAHHPKRFSNTYLFYKMGWRGINIDAMPGSMRKFKEVRPEDINIEAAISDNDELLKYYIFNEKALNTFSKNEAEQKNGKDNYKVIDEIMIDTIPLSEVLNKHLNSNEQIDFLNIDVEGLDLDVLKSNNWSNFKPKIILVELLNISSFSEIERSDINRFLMSKGYFIFAKTANTCFFKFLE